jgi:hypothetical protein
MAGQDRSDERRLPVQRDVGVGLTDDPALTINA